MSASLSRRRTISCLLLALAAVAAAPLDRSASAQSGSTDEPVIAAAASLQFALEEIVAAFKAETGSSVKVSFGSSGNFARQIRQGAPYQVFLSADEQFVLDLARDGLTRDDGAIYAVGRIVIFAPHGSPLKPDAGLDGLAAALADGRITRFAIANLEHAPYGKAAEEALRHRRLWDSIRPRLVLGENISQAAQFAASANAQGGIIAYSLAVSPRVSALGTFALIPEQWHSPLRNRMVLLKSAGPVAERFHAYIQGPAARAIFRQFGYVMPGGAS
ncbi:MAG: molybdate ABC transporter substrate-binding protein [Hyphomicrobiaceae bacterium]|nr:molybdate ABC transporter substrate-binding protein [Hyphomicrobiaceae bacterium]